MKKPEVSLFTRLLDLISPRLCSICGQRLSVTEESLCASCNLHLPRTGFQFNAYDNPMARLFWGRFPVERAVAYVYYEPSSEVAKAVYDLKYHHQREIGDVLGRMMGAELAGSGFFDGIDGIVPVPLTRKRLRLRGYNQSKVLAEGVGQATGLRVFEGVVERTVFTESQTRMGVWQRAENVENAFRLKDGDRIRGRHVLLIDDIVTTGATIISCARELLKAEDVRLSILALGFTKS